MALDIQLRAAQPVDLAADVLVVGVLQVGGKSPALPPSLKPVDARWGVRSRSSPRARSSRASAIRRSRSRRSGASRPTRSSSSAWASGASLGAPEVRTFAAKAARVGERREGEVAGALASGRARGRAARSRRGARARRVPVHEVPDRRPQAEGGARAAWSSASAAKPSPTRRRCSRSGQRVGSGGQPVARPEQRAGQRHLPGDVRRGRGGGREGERPEDRGLRLQGDPPPRDEAHRRGRPRQLARAALRAHVVDAQGREAEARLRRQGDHVRQRRPEHQARRRHGRDEARHERRRERRRRSWRRSPRSSRRSRCTPSPRSPRTCPTATRTGPGDIWGSLDGKTVEIVNTDAEGRLVLADALAYARTLTPDLIVDNATLTGACVVALGNTCSGWYSNDEAIAREFDGALKRLGRADVAHAAARGAARADQERGRRRQAGGRPLGRVDHRRALPARVRRRTRSGSTATSPAPRRSTGRTAWMQAKGATGHGVLTFLAMIERATLSPPSDA